ncbi:hypothetical protein G7Y89_g2744 [Cudoniella acicularis]|uniref:Cytochrome P450 n=1 Tax=Cudoniella acicularis TaxID=354080 RepID=A0A8H4RU03_9HELO|nr:hypothetical protein G7Y89_g2744 [Cudoniella acicularis]
METRSVYRGLLEALKEIYSSGGSGYDKTEFYTLFKQFDTRTMFSTLWKGDHSQKKRHIANQYANTNILRPQVIKGIQELADAFVNKCVESQEKSMDAYVYLHCYALDCASHHLFNPYGLHSINKPEDRKIMEELSYHDSLKGFPLDHLLQYYLPTLTTLLSKIVKPRHSPLSNNYVINTCEKPDPGEHTLLYALQNSKDQFNPIQIAAECSDHFVAGIDTTGDALCFLMYQLSLPESSPIQEKLFHELNENKDKNWDELQYLDAIVKEGLRCFPPIPMSQPRYVPPGGRTINRYFLPAGTIVSCQAWSVHRLNEDVYVDGDTFSLERWLDSTRILEMNRLFFSFGAGGRGCTGRHRNEMSSQKSIFAFSDQNIFGYERADGPL